MNYEEATKEINQWAINSGLRRYCTEICQTHREKWQPKNRCCNGCLELSKNGCGLSIRNIFCTLWVCGSIHLDPFTYPIYRKIRDHLHDVMSMSNIYRRDLTKICKEKKMEFDARIIKQIRKVRIRCMEIPSAYLEAIKRKGK
jgi:hypothetical protein